jgi:hypothetical protein
MVALRGERSGYALRVAPYVRTSWNAMSKRYREFSGVGKTLSFETFS